MDTSRPVRSLDENTRVEWKENHPRPRGRLNKLDLLTRH